MDTETVKLFIGKKILMEIITADPNRNYLYRGWISQINPDNTILFTDKYNHLISVDVSKIVKIETVSEVKQK